MKEKASSRREQGRYVGNRTTVQCVARCGEWVATNDHNKRVSLQNRTEADRRAVPRLHVHTRLARPTGRRQAHKSNAAPYSAHSPGRRRPAFRMPLAQMQAAHSAPSEQAATEMAGAKGLERARRGGCGHEERKAACTRHGEPARARPRPHARKGCRAGRGVRIVAPSLAGSCRQIVKGLPLSGKAFLFANRKSTANRKIRRFRTRGKKIPDAPPARPELAF